MKKIFVSLLAFALMPQVSWSADGDIFYADSEEGVSIRFQVLSEENKTCIVYTGDHPERAIDTSYEGPLTIPSVANGYTVVDMTGGAFSGCKITSVVLPNTMTQWSSQSGWKYGMQYTDFFSSNTKLASVTISEGITTIGYDAFYMCTGLTSITLPKSLTRIGYEAFKGSGLTEIVIPSNVNFIEQMAFATEGGDQSSSILSSATFDNCCPEFDFSDYYAVRFSADDIYYPAYAYSYYQGLLSDGIISGTLHPQIKIDREWTTYCATESFDVPEGIDAYVVKSYDAGVVTLQKVTTINAGQGLLLKPAEVGTFYNTTVCASAPDPYESNMLKGVTTATAIGATDGEYTNFIFTKVNGELGFYPANAGTIPANKAYLQIPTASLPSGDPSRLSIAIDDETTSVERVKTNTEKDSNWYTLGGVQAKQPTKSGVYIHQGKKVIIK